MDRATPTGISLFTLVAFAQAIVTDVELTPFEQPAEHSSTASEFTVSLTLSRYLYNGPDGLSQWMRSYNGELAGPTLRLKPGDTFHLALTNNLESEAFDTAVCDQESNSRLLVRLSV